MKFVGFTAAAVELVRALAQLAGIKTIKFVNFFIENFQIYAFHCCSSHFSGQSKLFSILASGKHQKFWMMMLFNEFEFIKISKITSCSFTFLRLCSCDDGIRSENERSNGSRNESRRNLLFSEDLQAFQIPAQHPSETSEFVCSLTIILVEEQGAIVSTRERGKW